MGNLSSRRNKEYKILMAGLDHAGKTTALYFLKYREVNIPWTGPTISFNVETVTHQGYDFVIWDVSGKDKIRRMWKHYFKSTDGIIFVVDSTDFEEKIEECKEALSLLIREDLLKGCTLLVLANKQDLPEAVPPESIVEKLELDSIRDRRWHIEDTCATTGEGLSEGLDWLSATLAELRQS